MMYISVKQASEKWGISDRRVRILCSEGRIPGVIRRGAVGRFRQGLGSRRTDVISPQKICLIVLTGRKRN